MAARRRTKIVATLGPASTEAGVLDAMIEAGTDLVRLNFSHGDPAAHATLAEKVRNRAQAYGRQVGILADLQGPKIRIGVFANGSTNLVNGRPFVLEAKCDSGDEQTCQAVEDWHYWLGRGYSF